MNYENQDWEMSFKDLFFNVLYKWKPIFAVAVVLSLLIGGVQMSRALKTSGAEREQKIKEYQEELVILEEQLGTAEMAVKEQKEYVLNSPLMHIDSKNVCEASLHLFISTDYQIMPDMVYQNPDESDSIMKVYQYVLSSSETIGQIAKKIGIPQKYLPELVSVSKETNHMMKVSVIHSEKAVAEDILDLLVQHVDTAHQSASEVIGGHTVEIVLKTGSEHNERDDIESKQDKQHEKLSEYEAELLEIQKKIKKLQNNNPENEKKIFNKQLVVWSALGFAAGVCLMAGYYVFVFVFRTTVYSADELKERTTLRILGTLYPNGRRMDPIVRLLRKKEKRILCNSEDNLELIAENIVSYTAPSACILLTGNSDEEQLAFAENLQKKLLNRKIVSCGNLLKSAAAVRQLRDCDGVILYETAGQSGYKEILATAEYAASLDKPVLGCIVVD